MTNARRGTCTCGPEEKCSECLPYRGRDFEEFNRALRELGQALRRALVELLDPIAARLTAWLDRRKGR